jgi:hypothetical protein
MEACLARNRMVHWWYWADGGAAFSVGCARAQRLY